MTDVVSLPPPVEASQVRSRTDRFVCVPYAVTITANTCAQRQATVRAGVKLIEFGKCVGCKLGEEVEERSGGKAADVAGLRWNQQVKARKGAAANKKRAQADVRLRVLDEHEDPDEATIPTIGDSLEARSDEDLDEGEEQESASEQAPARDTEPSPPPKPEPNERTMSATTEDKRLRQNEWQKVYSLRKKLKAAGVDLPPKGTPIEKLEALLRQSGAGNGHSSTNGKARSVSVGNGVRIVKPPRGRPSKPKAVAPATSLAGELARAVEAVELLDRIGWDRARTIAAMLEEARSE